MTATTTPSVVAPPQRPTTSLDSSIRRPRRPLSAVARLIIHVIVVVLMIIWFTPVLALFVSSIRTEQDTASSGWWTAFVEPLFTGYNYQQAISVLGVGESLASSLAIAIPVTVLTVLLSTLGAYALTRMRFVGRTVLSLILVAMLVIPPQVTLVPVLKLYNAIGISGTIPAVWIYQIGFTVPFGIFLLRGFMASIPEELFEAASVDGAKPLRVFRSIVIPLAVPVMASLAIMQFLWSWNDLLIPLLFLGGGSTSAPITVGVAGLVQATGQGQAMAMAATFVSIVIPLILVISLQRFFVRGVLGGAVKG